MRFLKTPGLVAVLMAWGQPWMVATATAGTIVIKSGDDGILASSTCIPQAEVGPAISIAKHPAYSIIPDTSWLHPDATDQITLCSVFLVKFDIPEGYGTPKLVVDVLVDDSARIFLNGNSIGTPKSFETVTTIQDKNVKHFHSGTNVLRLEDVNDFGSFGIDFMLTVTYSEGDPQLDTDGDGMPDWWEVQYGLNSKSGGDAGLDPDNDGLTNLQEWEHKTDPTLADTDGDGLKDGEETQIGTDPTKWDTDEDGYSDGDEISSGSDPLRAGSKPNRETVTIASGADMLVAQCSDASGVFQPVKRIDKIDAWDIVPGSSWVQQPAGMPSGCLKFQATFDLPERYSQPSLEMLVFVDGSTKVDLNANLLGTCHGFGQPPSQIRTATADFFSAGENTLEFEFSSDGGGDGLDFLAKVTYVPDGQQGSPNLLVNGSFEVGPPCDPNGFVTVTSGSSLIQGWTVSRGSIAYNCTTLQHADGKASIELNGDEPGAIQQTFSTTPDQDYLVTFSLAGDPSCGPPAIKKMTVEAAGQKQEFDFDSTGASTTDMRWATNTWKFKAVDFQTTIEFNTLIDGACGNTLDNISVIPLNSPPPLFTVEMVQNLRRCVSIVISNQEPIQGGEIGIAFDADVVSPSAIKPGADFPPGGDLHFDLQAQDNCPVEQGVKAGLTVGWLNSPKNEPLTSPGTHEILRICFDLAAGQPAGTCSPLKFVRCLGVPEAPVSNIITDANGTSQSLSATDGQVCILEELSFIRGDVNADDHFDISDAIDILGCLFLGSSCSRCPDAMDSNDDGLVNITDPIYLLEWRFSDGPQPPAPFPACGRDPSLDSLDDCESFQFCR